jgi:hypothetical protein
MPAAGLLPVDCSGSGWYFWPGCWGMSRDSWANICAVAPDPGAAADAAADAAASVINSALPGLPGLPSMSSLLPLLLVGAGIVMVFAEGLKK